MLTFTKAQPKDYDEFMQLQAKQAGHYLDQTLELMGTTWQEYTHLFQTVGQVFGIYRDGQLAGFYWIEQRDRILHLHGLILKSEFQGQGIGSQVLTLLETEYRARVDAIELGVHESNVRAIALYERFGYRTVKTLADLGFLVMQKELEADP